MTQPNPGPVKTPDSLPELPAADLARALVLLHRYTQDLNAAARQILGEGFTSNRNVMVLLAILDNPGITPSELEQRLRLPRISVSRSTKQLVAAGLAISSPGEKDRRTVAFWLTPTGKRRMRRLESDLRSSFMACQPLAKEAGALLRQPAPEEDPVRAKDAIGTIRTLAELGAAFMDDVREALAPFGIGDGSERHALTQLLLNGPVRPNDLAHELVLTPAGISGLLDRLEDAGVISRSHDLVPGDRRAVLVDLTGRGRDAMDAQLAVFVRHAPALISALGATMATSD